MSLTRSEVEILIKARNEAQGAFDALSAQVTNVAGASVKATASLDQMGRATKDAGTAAGGAGVAFGMFAERAAEKIFSMGKEVLLTAARTEGLVAVATMLGQRAGYTAGQVEDLMNQLKKQGITTQDAAQTINNLVRANLSLENATKLATVAQNAAFIAGKNSSEALDGILTGIVTLQPELLRNNGITVSYEQALMSFAKTSGRAAETIGIQEKQQILMNEVFKQGERLTGVYGLSMGYVGKQIASLTRYQEEAGNAIGKVLLPPLGAAVLGYTELLKIVTVLPGPFIALGAAITAVVLPLGLAKMGAALSIPSFATLAGEFGKVFNATIGLPPALIATTTSMKSVTVGLETTTVAVVTEGNAAEVAAAKTGLLKTALLSLFLIPAAWEFGKSIGDLVVKMQTLGKDSESTGGKVAAAFMKYSGVGAVATSIQDITEATALAASGTVSLAEQTKAIGKASELTGTQITSYSRAVAILSQEAVAGEGKMRKYLASLQPQPFKPPSLKDALALGDQIAKIGDAANVSKKRIEGWESELGRVASVGALPALRKELDLGVLTTKELTTQFGLSEDAIKYYEKKLKDAETATKAHTKAQEDAKKKTEEQQKATEKLWGELDKLGIVTSASGAKILKDLGEPLALLATVKGPALSAALIRLLPELEELAKKAAVSGVTVNGLAAALDRSKAAANAQITPMLAWEASLPTASIEELWKGTHTFTVEQELAGVEARTTAEAFKYFGISTRAELQKTATEATFAYKRIAQAVGANAPEAIEAYQKMIDAQKAASREIPSLWQSEIFPKVKGVIGTLSDAINGSFAQMLLGAKGFKAGFVDIWNSIKSAVTNILNSILSVFLNSFLKGILGAMAGQQNAFGAAFAGLFGGGTGGKGGAGSILGGIGSLFGTGAAATGAGGASLAGVGVMPGLGFGGAGVGGATAGGAAAGGGLLAAAGGGLAAAGVGFGLGKLFQNLFGGAGAAAGGAGALSGAATGALIGSVVPVLGTAVGAIAGSLAGLLGGLLGKSEGMKVNDLRDQFLLAFGPGGTGPDSGFGTLAAALSEMPTEFGGGPGGGPLFTNLITAKKIDSFKSAVQAVQDAMARWDQALKGIPESVTGGGGLGYGEAGGFAGPTIEGAAAKGVMADRPGLVVFGEGGEREVGGPASFFKGVFESLGLGAKSGATTGGGDTINIGPFNVTAMSSADLKTTIERDVIPPILDALRVNRRGSLTDMKAILGVA